METIFREDLTELGKLKFFDASNNELKTLPCNLFVGMEKIQHIFFDDNKLECFSSQFLKRLTKNNLLNVSFKNNRMIDAFFKADSGSGRGSGVSLDKLMEIIDEKCGLPGDGLQNTKCELKSIDMMKKVGSGLQELLTTGMHSDSIIKVGLKEFKVHKVVLSLFSEEAKSMFLAKEDNKYIWEIENFSEAAMEDFIKFIYSGKVPDDKNINELFRMGFDFKVPELQEMCTEIFLDSLDLSNALEIYTLAEHYGCVGLKKSAAAEIKKIFPKKSQPSEEVMNDTGLLKDIVEGFRVNKRKIEEANKEIELLFKRAKKE